MVVVSGGDRESCHFQVLLCQGPQWQALLSQGLLTMKKTHFSSPSVAGRAPTLALVSLIRDMTCLSFLGPRRSYYWTSCLLAGLEASPGTNQGLLIVTQPRLDDPGQSLAGLPVADMEPTRRRLVPVLGDAAVPSLACAASTGLDRRKVPRPDLSLFTNQAAATVP